MPFTLKVDGQTFNTTDLTLNEAIAIEEETGESWLFINPLRSARHNRAISRAFLLRSHPAEEVDAILAKVRLYDAVEGTNVADDDLPDEYESGIPKAEGGPSTPTSSPALAASDGRRT